MLLPKRRLVLRCLLLRLLKCTPASYNLSIAYDTATKQLLFVHICKMIVLYTQCLTDRGNKEMSRIIKETTTDKK